MIYFANPTGRAVDQMRAGMLGFIDTPMQGNARPDGVTWCADNGCFGTKTFNIEHWWAWLEKHSVDAATCLFATAPDVVGDHAATLERSAPWMPKIRALGYPVAFVAQDGATIDTVPWLEFDALFIGGTTEFKLGHTARELAAHAKGLGMWVHMGRVNSAKRIRYAESIGCDSVDGTHLVFQPDQALSDPVVGVQFKAGGLIDGHRRPHEVRPTLLQCGNREVGVDGLKVNQGGGDGVELGGGLCGHKYDCRPSELTCQHYVETDQKVLANG